MLTKDKIVFVGAGSMAEAMIAGLLSNKIVNPNQIWVTNHSNNARLTELNERYGVQTTRDYHKLFEASTVVILAMKPKDVEASLNTITPFMSEEQLIVSVIAGVSLTFIEKAFKRSIPVVRAMPNTSATVMQSATAITAGTFCDKKHIDKATAFLSSIGSVTFVQDEYDMHAVTAVSGSGPAYVYYLAEALQESATTQGLSEQMAKELVIQTFAGAENILQSQNDKPKKLRLAVMSPGGTTEAGIRALEERQFKDAVNACVKAATTRSQQLESMYRNE